VSIFRRRTPQVVTAPPRTKTFSVHVTDQRGVGLAGAVARIDAARAIEVETDANGRAFFAAIPWDTRQTQLTIAAEGYLPYTASILIPDRPTNDWPPIALPRARPRLRVDARRFVGEDGQPFVWNGITAFRLIELVATGRKPEAEAFLSWAQAQDITIVRALAMAANLFRLDPALGAAALPETLALAANYGLYVEVVALADTGAYAFDHRSHVQVIGAAAAAVANAVVEIANEPQHSTQDRRVWEPAYLMDLRAVIPPMVPVALGAAHGPNDESRAFVGGDYVTVHGDRADGDNGWRWVRHTNEQRALSEEIRKPVVNDEPRRDDLARDKQLGLALLCRILGLGDTFHYGGGLHAQIPEGAELEALEARRRGWNAVPADFFGGYKNTGHTGSPVINADFSTVVRMYSAVRETDGYTLALGAATGGPRFTWSAEWPGRELLLQEGGVWFWRVTKPRAVQTSQG
jgi:hypothetical protein